MTVNWLLTNHVQSQVYYRLAGTNEWLFAKGTHHSLPTSDRRVYQVELTHLAPRANYEFCFSPDEKIFRFRTMPRTLDTPVRFIEGGDVYHQRKWMDNMNELAGKFDPAFVVFGGDLAYARQRQITPENITRWDDFFDSWKRKARAPDGRLIPMLVTIGNHEVSGFWGQTPKRATGYYALFPTPEDRGYRCLDFGKYLSILLLDSGITHSIEGEQTRWLRDKLSARREVPHVFPVYHIPAYPSERPEVGGENGDYSQSIREQWCPLFDRYGVRISFEHHDHAFKRTYPLRGGKIDPKGVVNLGDGAWGGVMREPDLANPRWYIARTLSVRHFYVVTLYDEARHIIAVNERGETFDEVYQKVKR